MKNTPRPTEEAYAELQQAYDFYNTQLFDGALPPCLITFQRQKATFGYFHRNRFVNLDGTTTDEIALNPGYFAVVPLVEVLQTIVHEMTHQWQDHFGKPSRACYHNREWADKMESIGLMPSSTGQPGGKRVGQQMGDYVIEGGAFDQATKLLIESGFAISWLDRLTEKPPSKYLPASAGIEAGIDGKGAVEAAIENSPWVAPSVSRPGLVIDAHQQAQKRTKFKYSCGPCKFSVWGKPGLKLNCGDCGTALVPDGVVSENGK